MLKGIYDFMKLHCTVINTTYRKPRGRGRVPFSYKAIRTSEALSSILAPDAQVEALTQQLAGTALQLDGVDVHTHVGQGPSRARRREKLKPLDVSLGSWCVDEIQICKMGSYGPEGEYVAEARCSIV